MIQDNTQDLLATAPTGVQFVKSTFGLDLNPDFGTGQNARKSPLPGLGSEILFRCDVEQAFIASEGTPIAQFHVALSELGDGVEIHTGSNVIIIGSSLSSTHIVGGRVHNGYVAAQLAQGNRFFIRFNPWTSPMGRNQAGATVIGKDLRFLGVLITNPLFDTTNKWDSGFLRCRLVKQGDILQDPEDFAYAAGTKIVG